MTPSERAMQTYPERLRSQLKAWEEEIDRLQLQLENSPVHRLENQNLLRDLREKHEDADAQLSQLEAAAEHTLEEVRRGTEDAWQELADSLHKARQSFPRGKSEDR